MEAHLIIVTIFAILSALICLAIVIWVLYRITRPRRDAPRVHVHVPARTRPVHVQAHVPAPAREPEPILEPPPPSRNLWTDSQPHELEYGFLEQKLEDDLGLVYGTDCAVCNDTMDGRSTIAKIKRCNHSFHRECIGQWYEAQATGAQPISCPICRGPVTKKHIFIKMRDLTSGV